MSDRLTRKARDRDVSDAFKTEVRARWAALTGHERHAFLRETGAARAAHDVHSYRLTDELEDFGHWTGDVWRAIFRAVAA